jgi:hypothetical protein
MRERIGAVAFAGGAAALAIVVTATTALAATAPPWTVMPGGSIKLNPTVARFKDTSTSKVVRCTSSNGMGTLKSGNQFGAGIGTITSLSYGGCTGPQQLALTVTSTKQWTLDATSYGAPSQVARFKAHGIDLTISGAGCKATIAGASATTAGEVKAHYHNTTGVLTLLPAGGNLHVYAVTGCTGLFKTGDAIELYSNYMVTPKQKITKS